MYHKDTNQKMEKHKLGRFFLEKKNQVELICLVQKIQVGQKFEPLRLH